MNRTFGKGTIQRDGKRCRGVVMIDGRRYSVRGETKTEVEEELARISRQVRQGNVRQVTSKTTVGEWLDLWLLGVELRAANGRLKARTFDTYARAVRLHLKGIADIKLGALDSKMVQSWQDRALNGPKPASRSAISQAQRTLRTALAEAVSEGHIATNPASSVKLPTARPKPANSDVLSPVQGAQLWAAAVALEGVTFNQARIGLGTLCGMRQAEVLGLMLDHVDLNAGLIYVQQIKARPAFKHGCGGSCGKTPGRCPARIATPDIGTPKTFKGNRTVPVPPVLVDLLRAQKQAVLELRMRSAGAWRDDRPWLFPGEGGATPDLRADSRRWAAFVRETLGPDAPTGTHAGRRHAATAYLTAGVDAPTVMAMFGWASERQMLDYLRNDPRHMQAAAAKVWGALGAGGNPFTGTG